MSESELLFNFLPNFFFFVYIAVSVFATILQVLYVAAKDVEKTTFVKMKWNEKTIHNSYLTEDMFPGLQVSVVSVKLWKHEF